MKKAGKSFWNSEEELFLSPASAEQKAISAPEFAKKIYDLVEQIPAGKVASYGQLAMLAGYPQWARRAGKAISMAPRDLTNHRVVNSAGRLVPGWKEQRDYLLQEGIEFKENGCVDMKKHRWQPFLEEDKQ